MNKESLPLWMQEASENEMSSDTGSVYSGDSESSSDDEVNELLMVLLSSL